jgi:putative restriction endonuclease
MKKMARNDWTRDQLIVAFNLYCKLGFTKIKYTHPAIIELSKLINRTPSAVAFKLVNFARLDPELKKRGVKGMSHGNSGEEAIWEEFNSNWDKLAYESELLLANYKHVPVEALSDIDEIKIGKEGLDREALVKIRVNQGFFRSTVLTSYENKCCITGISMPQLLVASHIIPWSIDKENRVNPHNGLCLNALHDKAFDKGLITITPDYKIKVSPYLLESKNAESLGFILNVHNKEIIKPARFVPARDFLEYHNEKVFKKS